MGKWNLTFGSEWAASMIQRKEDGHEEETGDGYKNKNDIHRR